MDIYDFLDNIPDVIRPQSRPAIVTLNTVDTAIPPKYVKTSLEERGLCPHDTTDIFVALSECWLLPREHPNRITEEEMFTHKPVKKCLACRTTLSPALRKVQAHLQSRNNS